MPRSGSRLDTINETQSPPQNFIVHDNQNINAHNFGSNNQKMQGNNYQSSNIQAGGGLNNGRAGFGRGLGGIGGSIISSSGVNQNFKDFTNGAVASGFQSSNNHHMNILKPSNINPTQNF